jgi:hypothetical protein
MSTSDYYAIGQSDNPLLMIRRMRDSITYKAGKEYLVRIAPGVKLKRFTAGRGVPIVVRAVKGWYGYKAEKAEIISRIVESGHTDVMAASSGRLNLRYACDIARNPAECEEIERLYTLNSKRVLAGTPQRPQRRASGVQGLAEQKSMSDLRGAVLNQDGFGSGATQANSDGTLVHGNWDDESFEEALATVQPTQNSHPLTIGGSPEPVPVPKPTGFAPDPVTVPEPDPISAADAAAEIAHLQSLVEKAPDLPRPKKRPTPPRKNVDITSDDLEPDLSRHP